MRVPWLSKESIERIAADVIFGYELALGSRIEPPIPVEDIIERYLGLRISFIDFESKLGLENVLGATYVEKRLVCANESLLENRLEGCLNFTFAHEAGHWVLHRNLVKTHDQAPQRESVILCRTRDAKRPIEWQADYFASCLLMPSRRVQTAFVTVCGDRPLVFHNCEAAFRGPFSIDPCVNNWHHIAAVIRRAGNFLNVSKQAMIIRLQNLGLVVNHTDAEMNWKSRYTPSVVV